HKYSTVLLYMRILLFFFTYATPPDFSTLSLHDALPIFPFRRRQHVGVDGARGAAQPLAQRGDVDLAGVARHRQFDRRVERVGGRSEEHTSELQSRENLVCRLLLEKKKFFIDRLVLFCCE